MFKDTYRIKFANGQTRTINVREIAPPSAVTREEIASARGSSDLQGARKSP